MLVLTIASAKHLRTLPDAAEKRIQATGGIQHNDLWRQVDGKESK